MEQRYTIVNTTVTLTSANTQYEVAIPKDAAEFLARLDDVAVAWRFSPTAGVVAAGGFPLIAGESLPLGGPLARQTLYVAAASAGKVLHVSYLVPARLRP